MGCVGRKNSKPNIGIHGHDGGTRPGQTRKTPKNLSVHESEDRGREESVGLSAFVYYESMKRKLKIKPIYECRCDGRLQTKRFTRLSHTGLVVEKLNYESIKRELKTKPIKAEGKNGFFLKMFFFFFEKRLRDITLI